MEIKLKSMSIRNFKGCKELDIDFGNRTEIKGMNASGKTTVFDAFTFLIFGKDSSGSAKFDVRPLDENGKMINNTEITVEATITAGEDEYTLKKIQKQIWRKKRGTDTTEFQGNKNEFEISGYPKTEDEFKKFISGIVDENVFNLVTNPNSFTSLPWKEQREILMKFIGNLSDVDIATRRGDRFAVLIPELRIASTDDILKKYDKARKALNRQMDGIPERIDELTRQMVSVDVGALEVEKSAKQVELKKIEDQLSGGKNHAEEIGNLRQQVIDEKLKLSGLQNDANAKLDEQRSEARKAVNKADERVTSEQRDIRDAENVLSDYRKAKQKSESDKEEYGKQWLAQKHSSYPEFVALPDFVEPDPLNESDFTCPTCGQELPEEVKKSRIESHEKRCAQLRSEYQKKAEAHKADYEKKKAAFEEKRTSEMERIRQLGQKAADDIRKYEKSISDQELDLSGMRETLKSEQEELESSKKVLSSIPEAADISDTDEYKEIFGNIHSLACEISELEKNIPDNTELNARADEIRSEIIDIEAKIKAADNTKTQERIAELEEEQKSIGQKIAEQEQMIDLTEDFIRTKMNMISEAINGKFSVVSFKLFSDQINGGLKETCECTVNGVPYASLNSGHKIVAGLDIIKSISELYGITCPIWIDNAESINGFNIPDMAAQMIFMRVTDGKTLSIERMGNK